jgi:hypothetical protein
LGGTINVSPGDRQITSPSELPNTPFQITKVYCNRNSQVTDEVLTKLAGCVGLRQLEIENSNITDAGLGQLKGLARLECLKIGGSKGITNAGLDGLMDMTNLTQLGLNFTGVTGAGIKKLQLLRALETLDLSGLEMGNSALRDLGGFPKISTLVLNGSGISDDDLALVGLLVGNLHVLQLKGNTGITDNGLDHLKSMKSLQRLDLRGTHVSKEGVDALDALIPSCVIVVDRVLTSRNASLYLAELPEISRSAEMPHGIEWFSKNGQIVTGGPKNQLRCAYPMEVNGVHSPHGIYMHAKPNGFSSVKFQLNGSLASFHGQVAIPTSETFIIQSDPKTPLSFQVLKGTGEVLWQSRRLKKKNESQAFNVDVRGVKVLELRVLCPGASGWACAAWIEPTLE